MGLVDSLIKHKIVQSDIGVITPYRAQQSLLRTAVLHSEVEVHTVDKYQGGAVVVWYDCIDLCVVGRDKECVIVSLVCSNPARKGNLNCIVRVS